MDTLVAAALKKWPNVPHCYNWLALDARGEWYMRDERVQTQGPFPQAKGSRIEHEKLREFIARNYDADDRGAWFFQNGPQRVYVELEAAPYVWRLQGPPRGFDPESEPKVASHTGRSAKVRESWIDEDGRLYLACDIGFGLVHTLDMEAAADAVESGLWTPRNCRREALPKRFGFVREPHLAALAM